MAKRNYAELVALVRRAHEAGLAAGAAATPPVMVVRKHANPFDDKSPVLDEWVIPDGPCGFAWVTVRPANAPIAKALKLAFPNRVRPGYHGGAEFSVWEFNQSMVRKERYAEAFAAVLTSAGHTAHAGSRMD